MSRLLLMISMFCLGSMANAQTPVPVPLAMPVAPSVPMNQPGFAPTATPIVVDTTASPVPIYVTVTAPNCPTCEAKAQKAAAKTTGGLKKLDKHCGKDPCPNPIGCSTFWSEARFIFGGCRSFFGAGNSDQDCCPSSRR